MFVIVDDHQRQRRPEHGYTISSPCEPDRSGELKISQLTSENCPFLQLLKMMVYCIGVLTYELRHEKTGFLHMQKQRRRSASQ